MKKITASERRLFKKLFNHKLKIKLVRSQINGVDVPVVCTFRDTVLDNNGAGVDLSPIAIIVTDEVFGMLKEPKGVVETVETIIKKESVSDEQIV